MKRFIHLFIFICLVAFQAEAQLYNNCTTPAAEQVMLGMYDPASYAATTVINDPNTMCAGLNSRVSPDTLHAYLDILKSFHNRNSGSDTSSTVRGFGAARNWVFSRFQDISTQNENRLIPSFLEFDTGICSINRHKDVFAVLPGTDTTDKSVIIIEGHMDSRCTDLCDTACVAQGMEDNGSGTALVIELARVMSKYSYNHTIIFLLTTAEEQGLLGAQAFASYVNRHGIKVKAVMNNDVIGGVICGHTSSPPSCPGYEAIDSTQVRLFSNGGFNSFHKGLSRYIKLEYKEMLRPIVSVPMTVSIMTPEDRTGRGGDHIPFRAMGYTAMRFTSANEAGNADVSSGSYIDRQHTSSDSIGVDINGDGVMDTFFVDFNYLARNTVINGNAAGMIGISPQVPDFTLTTTPGNLVITITQHTEYLNYRVGVRSTTNDWDSVYTFTGSLTDNIQVDTGGKYIVSVASVDDKGVESLFSREQMVTALPTNGIAPLSQQPRNIELLQNKPNPADEVTNISVLVNSAISYKDAYISIRDLAGKEVSRSKIELNNGVNEIQYDHGYNMSGTFIYTLFIDGKAIESRRMVFTN
ncbi:MAG: C-terminal target protein [Flavipsychrobacter sp.]|nr:C-terminal target protein [Flavipsychrobacter sp.]